tara:strand:+ start:2575 stop:3192 length:618 start_codon:yes stop_codon:yes gene_type:complete
MQENIFCKQCGKPGTTTENFCKYCGEQINSDSINSISDESTQIPVEDIIPNNYTQEFILASRMKRLFARLLDVVFGVIAALIPGFVLTFLSGGNFDPEPFLLGAVVGIISFVIYQWYLLATTAQTIGKKYLKIKIVNKDGEQAGFFVNVVLREWVMALIGIFPAIGGIIQLVDILFIFRDDRKCIHDLIAGTVVISTTFTKKVTP